METKSRKGQVVTIKIGEDKKKRIPRVFDTIYKMVKTPVDDDDETFNLHTLRTIDVEGVTIVDGGRAVNINGDFDISLEDENDDERFSADKVWADKDEAVTVWEYLTKLQLDKAEARQARINNVVNCLRDSLNERQY